MIQREYRLDRPYRVAIYARMSDPKQNKRSPEQQVAQVKEVMGRLNCPWTVVGVYVDRGIKGRYLKRRPDLQRLLHAIAIGLVVVDLIVVDTFERFGRADEFEEVRRRLRVDHGVMIVAADNGFADPTGVVGKAVNMVEQIRATEDGRIKAHNVVRGKKDALRRKRWPGGPPPFGYRLKKCLGGGGGGAEPEVYSVLEPEPDTALVLQRLFAKAAETGWGGTRLAKWLNADAAIPAHFKPFYGSTVTMWLANEVYVGVGIWGKLNTDIANDARVVERNPHPEEVVRIEGFCEPLVTREVFDRVAAVRAARAERPRDAGGGQGGDGGGGGGKLIRPVSPGLSVKHQLAGLVHCGECNACCVPRSSGRKSKSGQEYTYYTCPRHNDGACGNANHVRVDHLWPAVVARLRRRLFPVEPGAVPDWFGDFVGRVDAQLRRLTADGPRRGEQVREQLRQLEAQMGGWRQSLGSPQLAAAVRQDLERDYLAASQRRSELEAGLAAERAMERELGRVLDPRQVAESLGRLDEVLRAANPCLVNLELARHVERVDCFADGRVVLRGTWLGLFDGAADLLRGGGEDGGERVDGVAAPRGGGRSADGAGQASPPSPGPVLARVRSRRLARRRVDGLSGDRGAGGATDVGSGRGGDAAAGLDPNRFAGLSGCFLWEEDVSMDPKRCWAESHASAVAAKRDEDPKAWTLVALAAHFRVSTPTVRKALRLAAAPPAGNVPPPEDARAARGDAAAVRPPRLFARS